MKDCIFFSSVNCLGLLAALLTLADCGSGGSLIRNPKSEIRNWEPVGLSGGGDDMPFSKTQRVTFEPSDDGLIYVTTFGGSVWRGQAVPHRE